MEKESRIKRGEKREEKKERRIKKGENRDKERRGKRGEKM
jgi:hypothetical protein